MNPDRRITVGLSFCLNKAQTDASIWSNGATQNTFFMYMMLIRSERIREVILLNAGDALAADVPASLMLGDTPLNIQPLYQAIARVDLLMEIGLKLGPDEVQCVRARGGKAVAYKVGNDYVMDVESIVFQERKGPVFNGAQFDEVWSIPQHMRTCASYWRVAQRCRVIEVPHIWSPHFCEQAMAQSVVRGYQMGRAKKRVSIFEPNVNVVKSCHYPMLGCEAAYRQRPDLFEAIYVLNTEHLKEHETFKQFALNLDIVTSNLASFESRHIAPLFLAQYSDIVVTHQWENALNYLYYDVLHGGYPLVHNSEMLKGIGYYYESFNAESCAHALIHAATQHDTHFVDYNRNAAALLRAIDIGNPSNINVHVDHMMRLWA